jgi:hypothetical protein
LKNIFIMGLALAAVLAPIIAATDEAEQFSVTPCGSIIDAKTNLEWFVGPDEAKDWNQARQWVAALGSCGGGWRMPALAELKAIHQPKYITGKGYSFQGVIIEPHLNPVFKGIGAGTEVWAAEVKDDANAWLFNFFYGQERVKPRLYALRARAFAVREKK